MILLRARQRATLLAFCTACSATSHDVSGTWQAGVTDSAACTHCIALFGFKLEQSSAGAIKGVAVADVVYKNDAASGVADVMGFRRGDSMQVTLIFEGCAEQEFVGIVDGRSSLIRGEMRSLDSSSQFSDHPYVLTFVRSRLDRRLATVLNEAKDP
jgi:hypothetical protein